VAFVGARRLPRAQAADVVVDAALADLDAAAARSDDDLVATIASFLEVVEEAPGRLADALPGPLVLPESGPWLLRAGLPDGRMAGCSATCAKCRKTFYLGEQLRRWVAADPGPEVLIATDIDEWRARVGLEWPAEALGRRVALYRHLSAVLTSVVQRM
jgi:hypothetical protein